jgi:tubulin polyglutamylase TTLL1/tubulin monoglycylase TTLL3/8
MKQIAVDLILSTAGRLNPKRREYTFEIFGLDYMLDDRLNPFLIEANSNPCIEVDGNVLSRVIPAML